MCYDLSIPWSANTVELQRILSFLADLGYTVIAINHEVTGKLPNELSSQIPNPLPFKVPSTLRIVRRCTLVVSDPSQNHRLASLATHYDLLALRPTTEKALQHCIQSPEADLISMDLTQRLPFYLRPKMFTPAIQRGLRIEICYGPAVAGGGTNLSSSMARRNLIANATALIRATRGRGIVLSSEARRVLECRAPFDVMNLVTVWGLRPERSREAVSNEAKAVVDGARRRRSCYRGTVDFVEGGAVESVKARSTMSLRHPASVDERAREEEPSLDGRAERRREKAGPEEKHDEELPRAAKRPRRTPR